MNCLILLQVICEDGHTYERQAITQWLKQNRISPMTRERIRNIKHLIPNRNLKSSIAEWKETHKGRY
jgi:U-box domain